MKLRVLAFSITLLASIAARAEDVRPPVSKHDVTLDMRSYYGGERASAYIIMVLGALSVGGGVALVTRDSDFARGFGWPLIGLGALEALGAIFYAFQCGAEIRHYQEAIDRDGVAFKHEELEHMHGTSSRFVFYRLTELGLVLGGAGVAIFGFASDQDVWKGIGLGVASIALPFLVIDSINNARATRYQEHVRDFDPAIASTRPSLPPLAGSPLFLSYGGRF